MSEKIEVIGAGFGRTGTMSLMAALNILGYKAYHMRTVFGKDEEIVVKAYQGGEEEFNLWMAKILEDGYTATTDFPTCMFYKEQMKMFPDAKVILTKRDPEKWFKSFETLMMMAGMTRARPTCWFSIHTKFLEDSIGATKGIYGREKLIPREEDFEWYNPWYFPWIKYPVAIHLDKETCIKYFLEHNEEVRRTVPKEKLLEMHVSEGWEPICKLLNKPIPDVPFPNVNSSDHVKERKRRAAFIGTVYPFIALSGLLFVGGLAVGAAKLIKRN